MRRDRIANEKIVDFFPPGTKTTGTTYSTIFDTMRVSTSQNRRENHTNVMLMISIASGWSATGVLEVAMQHCMDGLAGSMVLYATGDIMQGQESEDLYLMEIKDFNRYVRLRFVVVTASVTLCALGSFNRSRREDVVQVGREKTVTYNSAPITY